MNIETCKNCEYYSLDTLTDGTKEHYCYPPYFTHMIAFSIPCKNRTEEECKMILKAVDELPWITVGMEDDCK